MEGKGSFFEPSWIVLNRSRPLKTATLKNFRGESGGDRKKTQRWHFLLRTIPRQPYMCYGSGWWHGQVGNLSRRPEFHLVKHNHMRSLQMESSKKWFNIIYRENIGHAYVHFTYVYAAPQTNELRVLYPRKWVECNEEIYLKYIKVHRWQSQ